MFKFKIDKEAIELLCEAMKNNKLTEIEVKMEVKVLSYQKTTVRIIN